MWLFILQLTQGIIDFGFFILIWVVQLIIYPAFKFYKKEDLLLWHPLYTKAISIFVIPLMLIQSSLAAVLMYVEPTMWSIIYTSLVIATWALTFKYAVPLHNRIQKGEDLASIINDLLRVNLIRSIIWTVISVISIYKLGVAFT